jgi:N-methylhydantoinase A
LPEHSDRPLVGIDTGGTFTDLVLFAQGRLRHCKVLSTPDDPSRAISEGLERLGLQAAGVDIVHGTTVGTNAVLEGKGARVAYITSAGFADVLSLGRQEREQVYSLRQPPLRPPVPEEHCMEITTRLAADGSLLAASTDAELAALRQQLRQQGVEAVAINLLFSFLRPEEEQRVAAALGDEWFTSCSSEVLPEIREYERGIATWLNASVGPVIGRYLGELARRQPNARISVMQSSGTTVAADQAARRAVRLLLSGPAGGLAAALLVGAASNSTKLLTLDMGGTSTDVALLNGRIPLTNDSRLGRWPLTISSVDIHTIGAGGGSIARVDEGGLLLVGPESAGADPGPACYGQGGEQVTVTDANLVLGRIPETTLLGGYLPLNPAAAHTAMARLAAQLGCSDIEAAQGVVRMANEHMARALRVISVERGHDPRDYQLFCFGGAGGLHACELAELLQLRSITLPPLAGVQSALGMLASEPGRELSLAVLQPLAECADGQLAASFAQLEEDAAAALEAEGQPRPRLRFRRQLQLRYSGQSASITLPFEAGQDHAALFHAAHLDKAGHALERDVELVNLRLSASAPAALLSLPPAGRSEAGNVAPRQAPCEIPVHERSDFHAGLQVNGPAIIVDPVATAWLAPGWQAVMDEWGSLQLRRT